MKTTTIRLDEAVVEILEAASNHSATNTSELIRRWILMGFRSLADENEAFGRDYEEIAERRVEEKGEATRLSLGLAPKKNVEEEI